MKSASPDATRLRAMSRCFDRMLSGSVEDQAGALLFAIIVERAAAENGWRMLRAAWRKRRTLAALTIMSRTPGAALDPTDADGSRALEYVAVHHNATARAIIPDSWRAQAAR